MIRAIDLYGVSSKFLDLLQQNANSTSEIKSVFPLMGCTLSGDSYHRASGKERQFLQLHLSAIH